MENVERPISVFKALILAFYSTSFYRHVGTVWRRRRVMGFLLLFLLIFWIIGAGVYGVSEYTRYKALVAQIPNDLVITQGVVSTNVKQPYYIYNPGTKKELFAVIDTHGVYPNFKNSSAQFLLMKSGYRLKSFELRGRQRVTKVTTRIFANTLNLTASHKFLMSQARIIVYNEVAQRLLGGMLSSLIFSIVIAALYAILVSFLLAKFVARKINYNKAFDLAIVALLPGLFVFAIFFILNYVFVLLWLVVLVIHIAYLVLAARSQPLVSASEEKGDVEQSNLPPESSLDKSSDAAPESPHDKPADSTPESPQDKQ